MTIASCKVEILTLSSQLIQAIVAPVDKASVAEYFYTVRPTHVPSCCDATVFQLIQVRPIPKSICCWVFVQYQVSVFVQDTVLCCC